MLLILLHLLLPLECLPHNIPGSLGEPHLPPPSPTSFSMFQFKRSDVPPDQPEKPSVQPRNLSSQSPSISSIASLADASLLPRRAPFAPLQFTNAPLAADDPMSSSSSFLGYNPDDNSQESEPARFGIGRPIVPRTAPDNLNGNPASSSRRRSIPNQYVCLLRRYYSSRNMYTLSEPRAAPPYLDHLPCNLCVPFPDDQTIRHLLLPHPDEAHYPMSSTNRPPKPLPHSFNLLPLTTMPTT